MSHEPEWLVQVLDELAEREAFPDTPLIAARILNLLLSTEEGDRRRRIALAGAATLSLSAVVLVALRLHGGRPRLRRAA